jgi:hypothetical protein
MWRGGKGTDLESRNTRKREEEVVYVMSKSTYWSPPSEGDGDTSLCFALTPALPALHLLTPPLLSRLLSESTPTIGRPGPTGPAPEPQSGPGGSGSGPAPTPNVMDNTGEGGGE